MIAVEDLLRIQVQIPKRQLVLQVRKDGGARAHLGAERPLERLHQRLRSAVLRIDLFGGSCGCRCCGIPLRR